MRNAAIAILLAACTSSEPKTESQSAELTADEAWIQLALPALRAASCTTCHGNSNIDTIDFLAGNTDLEIRDTLLASGIVEEEMFQSRLLTKGFHEGNPLTGEQVDAILSWLELELGQ
jgi:hypothetical protein